MADQIEMTTADSAPKFSRDISPVFGQAGILRSTFSFATAANMKVSTNSSWTPFNMGMVKYADRVKTFTHWPIQMVQKPQQLLQSGFYYTGRGDHITCFFCGITLRNWDSTDDVDFEHKKHSPECKFLLMCRDI